MKKPNSQILFFVTIFLFSFDVAQCQVGINSDNSQADISAMLDVKSSTKGILIPRMTRSERDAIGSPSNGLMIYQTDYTAGFYYNSGTSAVPQWKLVGDGACFWKQEDDKRIFYNYGMVGVGSVYPTSKLNIRSAVDTIGTKFSLPYISSLPNPAYTHDAVIMWEGGEVKFGKWRNYFNGWEQDWALTYNAPWNYATNAWLGRDVGTSTANISAMMRFNVAEGNSGLNVFEIGFAPPGAAGTVPDWNGAAHYSFYDGRWSATSPMPAKFAISGAADMDAILSLNANSTVDAVRVNFIAVGANPSAKLFKIQNATSSLDLLCIKTETGIVGIGTSSPDPSAQLDLSSTTRGFLPPRMTSNQRNAISLPSEGLVIYNTDEKTLNIYNGSTWGVLSPVVCGQSFRDPRNNSVYNTVKIGTQCWMAQNLNLGNRINGSLDQINNGIIEKYCYNDLESNCDIYGGLYQWSEMMQYQTTEGIQGLCPTGWHLPSDAEWTVLTTNLGGLTISGGKMKEIGTTHWASPNTGATNSSGYTALPGGGRSGGVFFYVLTNTNLIWSSTQYDGTNSWSRRLYYNSADVSRQYNYKSDGFSIRCIQN